MVFKCELQPIPNLVDNPFVLNYELGGLGLTLNLLDIYKSFCDPNYTSCFLLEEGCSLSFSGVEASLDSSIPVQITLSNNIPSGWTKTFCLLCSLNGVSF